MTEITPTELLDRRRQLIEFYRSKEGRGWVAGFMKDVLQKGGYTTAFGPLPYRILEWGRRHRDADPATSGIKIPMDLVDTAMEAEAIKFCAKQTFILETADPYIVTEDMCQLIQFAADAGLPDDQITPEDIPSRIGFVVLDEPWLIRDKNCRTIVITGFTWELATDGHVHIEALSDLTDGRDEYSAEFMREFEKDQSPAARMLRRAAHLMIFDRMRVPLHRRIGQLPVDEEFIEHEPTADPRYVINLIRAFWAISQEVYVTKVLPEVSRATIKREVRFGLRNDPKVRVIKLRHRSDARHPDGEGGVLKHRFTVKGHWRRQACGPNRSERRLRWIAPFVKGPDGAPWLTGEKIYRLER